MNSLSRFQFFTFWISCVSLQVRRLLIGRQEHSGPPTGQWDWWRHRTSQKDLWVTEGQSEALMWKSNVSVAGFRLYTLSQQQPIRGEHKLWDNVNDWLFINSYCESEGLWLTRGQRVGLDLNLKCCLFQGAAADRFLDSLSGFINGLDTKNNVKVRNAETVRGSVNASRERVNFIYKAQYHKSQIASRGFTVWPQTFDPVWLWNQE